MPITLITRTRLTIKNLSKYLPLLLLIILVATAGCNERESGAPRARRPHVDSATVATKPWSKVSKVILIVLENTDYAYASVQPYISKLIPQGALLKSYYAIIRTSQPNYLAMIAGDTFGASNKNIDLEETHLGDLLEQKGKSWKNYAEGYPGDCFLDSRSGLYARKHVPFVSFKNVQDDPARCAKIVNADVFQTDFKNKTLPHFSMYIPDLKNDGHDTGITFADQWLSGFLDPLIKDPQVLEDTLFIVTFDEATVGSKNDNQVLTLFLGAGVQPGASSDQDYDHYCLLRTIEEIFGLPNLGRYDKDSPIIDDIWKK